MKKLTAITAMAMMATTAKGYVYSYPESLSADAQDAEADQWITPGPDAPPEFASAYAIATLVSYVILGGRTPYGNNAGIGPADLEYPSALSGVIVETSGIYTDAVPLSPGDVVGPGSNWEGGGLVGGYQDSTHPIGDPAFLAPQGAYVGIEFPDANNQVHYGWLLVRYVNTDYDPGYAYFGTLELLDVGYETDPGVPITIAPEPTAEIGAIALLALGSRFRRRQM